MSDSAVEVRIVGDASGVQPAVDQAKSSVSGLQATVGDLNSFLGTTKTKFEEAGTAAEAAGRKGSDGMKMFQKDTGGVIGAVENMIHKVHEGAENVRTFQQRAKEFAEVYVAIFAVDQFREIIDNMAKLAEETKKTAIIMGMGVAQVQALGGAAKMAGTSAESLQAALNHLNARVATTGKETSSAGKAFAAMGIHAGEGQTNMQRLLLVADKFHGMADGPQKTALAVQLFGRSAGPELVPFLNQGSTAIQQMEQKTRDLGAVNEEAIAKGEQLTNSVNESKVAWDGVKLTLMDGFAPLLTQIVDGFVGLVEWMHKSYETGGLVAIVFQTITEVVRGVGEILATLGDAFAEVFSTTGTDSINWGKVIKAVIDGVVVFIKGIIVWIEILALSFKSAFDEIVGGMAWFQSELRSFVDRMGGHLALAEERVKMFAKVAADALRFIGGGATWADIQKDWDEGTKKIDEIVKANGAQIVADAKAASQAAQGWFQAAADAAVKADKLKTTDLSVHHGPKHDALNFNPGGGTGAAPDLTPDAKGKKPKKGKDDLMQRLEQELQAQKNQWDELQIAQGTHEAFSLAKESAFWESKKGLAAAHSKDGIAIEEKANKAKLALSDQVFNAQVAKDEESLKKAGDNAALKLAIQKKITAEQVKYYHEGSKEADAAEKAEVAAQEAADKQKEAEIKQYNQNRKNAALETLNYIEQAAQGEVAAGRMTQGQLIQLQKRHAEEAYAIEVKELEDQLALDQKNPHLNPVELAKLQGQIQTLKMKFNQQMLALDQKAAAERTQIEKKAIDSVASSWASAISKMVTLQASFASTMKSLWQGVQQAIGGVIETIVQKFITGELTKLILHKASAKSMIMTDAAVAGAGGVASMAAAPFPMDMTAPAFGAAMQAAAMSFGVTSAAGGDWSVNEGLYHLHENEMVLPAWAASPLRDMVSGGSAANGNAPRAANDGGSAGDGGDTHLHFHSVMPPKPHEMEQFFKDHHRAVGAGVMKWKRNGGPSNA